MKNLYNNDGTLSIEAQFLLSPKPDGMSMTEWKKLLKEFRSQLSEKDAKELIRLRRNSNRVRGYTKNRAKELKARAKYYQNNREEELVRAKFYAKNYVDGGSEKKKETQKRYREANKEKLKEAQKRYIQSNKEKIKEARKRYRARRKKDPFFRFQQSLRVQCCRIVRKLSLGQKPTNTFKWIGCSAEELKTRFESLFVEGMSWDNYGEWHIDHIRPISSFKAEEWKQINHYSNLQPLWAEDNIKKSNKWQQET